VRRAEAELHVPELRRQPGTPPHSAGCQAANAPSLNATDLQASRLCRVAVAPILVSRTHDMDRVVNQQAAALASLRPAGRPTARPPGGCRTACPGQLTAGGATAVRSSLPRAARTPARATAGSVAAGLVSAMTGADGRWSGTWHRRVAVEHGGALGHGRLAMRTQGPCVADAAPALRASRPYRSS
jgi:hypothetical protein